MTDAAHSLSNTSTTRNSQLATRNSQLSDEDIAAVLAAVHLLRQRTQGPAAATGGSRWKRAGRLEAVQGAPVSGARPGPLTATAWTMLERPR